MVNCIRNFFGNFLLRRALINADDVNPGLLDECINLHETRVLMTNPKRKPGPKRTTTVSDELTAPTVPVYSSVLVVANSNTSDI